MPSGFHSVYFSDSLVYATVHSTGLPKWYCPLFGIPTQDRPGIGTRVFKTVLDKGYTLFFCLVGVFWTISGFCTPVLPKTGVQNRKNLRKTPASGLQDPKFLEKPPSKGYKILKADQKRPGNDAQAR